MVAQLDETGRSVLGPILTGAKVDLFSFEKGVLTMYIKSQAKLNVLL